MKLSLLKRARQPLLSSNSPRLHLPGIIPPLPSPAGLQDCEVWGGNLLLDMLLVLMLLKASTVEILDGNQPVGHAICGLQQLAGLLLLLPLHQEFLLLRSLDDIDPLSFINGVWWTSLSAPIHPYCPPHLLYCVLSTLMPPISFLLFMIAAPEKFSMLTRSLTCLSRQFGCDPVTFILKLTSALAS